MLPNGAKGEVWATKDYGPYLQVPEPNQQPIAGGPATNIVDIWGRPFQYDNIRDPQPSPNGYDAVPLEIRTTATFVTNPGANATRCRRPRSFTRRASVTSSTICITSATLITVTVGKRS